MSGARPFAARHVVTLDPEPGPGKPRDVRLCQSPTTENAPAGSRGDFWGYYREERYLSLYMWIRGRSVSPLVRRERCIVGGDERHMGDAELSHEVFVRSPYRSSSLNP